jgi:uncharacterized protein (TIGR03437 family)
VASVSAASYAGGSLAPESIVAAFGNDLATETVIASSVPLPTSLAGTTVKVRDGAGQERDASLFFVTSTQINYLIPAGTAPGVATITARSGSGKVSTGLVAITPIAPGIFSADSSGEGLAAATVLRIKPGGVLVDEAAVCFDPAQGKVVAVPIDLGPEGDDVFLLLFGTGIRFNSGGGGISCQLGGTNAQVLYIGPQGGFIGLDQMNVRLPRSLAGRGEIDVVVMIDGSTTRTVKVHLK